MTSLPFSGKRLYEWLDQRLYLSTYRHLAEKKLVPLHRQTFWYYMGGIVLVFILTQVLTGMLLMVYYIPEVKSAHTSILNINGLVDFGWFFRSIHSWGSNLMILALYIHFFSTYFMKAYRPPREINWWSGLLLNAIVFGFGFSGYLLPWDATAYFATKIGIDIAQSLPLIGPQLADLMRGGPIISQVTLSRFFTLHVILLPLLLAPLLGLHLLMIQLQGTSEPEWFQKLPSEKKAYEKFFPEFMLKDLMGWMATLSVLAILVALHPWGLGPEAQPFAPAPKGIKPEWYFLFLYQFFKLLPAHVGPLPGELFGIFSFGMVVLSLFLLPLWDTGVSEKRGKIAAWYGRILLLAFIVLTIWGKVS
jgi:cytochrome b6